MGKLEERKAANEAFMKEMAESDGIMQLENGVLAKIEEKGRGGATPNPRSIVICHYKGRLINGKEFDSSYRARTAPAFRLNQLIKGWQIALKKMHVGDRWTIYVPWTQGYGSRPAGSIPAYSTLIFDIKLLGIG